MMYVDFDNKLTLASLEELEQRFRNKETYEIKVDLPEGSIIESVLIYYTKEHEKEAKEYAERLTKV